MYFNQFDIEDEGGIRLYGAGAVFTIGQIRRDENLPFRTLFHHQERFRPALNDFI